MASKTGYKKPRTPAQQAADFRRLKYYKRGYTSMAEVEVAKRRAANWGFIAQLIETLFKFFR